MSIHGQPGYCECADAGQQAFTFTPSQPMRHGRTRWLRGEVQIGGVSIRVVASPNGVSLPSGISLTGALQSRLKAFLTAKAATLNRIREGATSPGRGGRAA